jgi:FkbM family methyltransferase
MPYTIFHGEYLQGEHVDQIIRRYFPSFDKKGVFLDIGAFEPIRISNSYHFEQNGWECYLFEANTEQIPILQAHRKNVYHCALAEEYRSDVVFHVVLSNGWTAGYSAITLDPLYESIFPCNDKKITNIHVEQRTLDSFFEKELKGVITEIDVMSLDIEGGEMNMLKGFTYIQQYPPKLIVLENVSNDKVIQSYLESVGYRLDYQSAYNQFYLHSTYQL